MNVKHFIVDAKQLHNDIINLQLSKIGKTAEDVISITTLNSENLIVFYRD